MLEPKSTCRICKCSGKEVSDLKGTDFCDLYQLVTMAKIEDLTYTKICVDCHKNFASVQKFFNVCMKSHEFFTKIEEEMTPEAPLSLTFNGFILKQENEESDDESPKKTSKTKRQPRDDDDDSDDGVPDFPIPQKVRNRTGRFDCTKCYKSFKRRDYLVDHMDTHVATPQQCPICIKLVKGYKNLNRHLRVAHDMDHITRQNTIHQMKKDRGDYPSQLSESQTSVAEEEPYFHEIAMVDITEIKIKQEREQESPEVPVRKKKNDRGGAFMCEICKAIFTRKDSLQDHTLTQHMDLPHFTCDMCNIDFKTRKLIFRHMRNIHLKTPVASVRKCYECQIVFESKGALKEHRKIFHRRNKIKGQPGEDDEELFKSVCHICGKTFHPKTLSLHVRMHSATRDYQCEKCSMTFCLKRRLQAHQKRCYAEGRPFTCQVCGKTYKCSTDLQRHLKFHDENRETYQCDQCNMTFEYKASYQRHVKLHSGFKPFQCDKCDKVFASSQNLKQHSYSHTGLRPYHCPTCDKGFYTKKVMLEHIEQVH